MFSYQRSTPVLSYHAAVPAEAASQLRPKSGREKDKRQFPRTSRPKLGIGALHGLGSAILEIERQAFEVQW